MIFGIKKHSKWRRGGSVVSASDLGPEGLEFKPWPRCTHVVSLGKTFNSHSVSFHPGV